VRIVLMGPPGAGKGTQAKRLADQFAMRHLSSGDILRAEKSSGSELGKQLASYMDAGKLVPDDTVVGVMAKALTSDASGKGLLLDGFPRTVPQAKALDAQLSKAGKPLSAIVVITCNDDLIVNRITGRRSCPKCGRVFHVKFLTPKTDGVCDDCGVALTQRADDTEAVVRKRLDAYNSQTQPVISYYRGCDGLEIIEVDGSLPADDVTNKLAKALQAVGSD
jgi:adenylate kinase